MNRSNNVESVCVVDGNETNLCKVDGRGTTPCKKCGVMFGMRGTETVFMCVRIAENVAFHESKCVEGTREYDGGISELLWCRISKNRLHMCYRQITKRCEEFSGYIRYG